MKAIIEPKRGSESQKSTQNTEEGIAMTIISDKDIEEIKAPLKKELESLRQENTRLRERIIKRDEIIKLIHNHGYHLECDCAVCGMYRREMLKPKLGLTH